jgi:hypothetical protein
MLWPSLQTKLGRLSRPLTKANNFHLIEHNRVSFLLAIASMLHPMSRARQPHVSMRPLLSSRPQASITNLAQDHCTHVPGTRCCRKRTPHYSRVIHSFWRTCLAYLSRSETGPKAILIQAQKCCQDFVASG